MRYLNIVLIFIALLSLSNCEKDSEVQPKEYPYVITYSPRVNSNGAEFSANLTNIGNQKILKYGFVWSVAYRPTIHDFNIFFDENPTKGIYSCNVNSELAKGITYYVRAYVLTDKHEVFGNEKSFKSQGSKFSPWELILQPQMRGWHDTHGTSSNELGFILFQSGEFYSYNPNNNSVTRKPNIPNDGNTGTSYASFNLDDYLYFLTNDSKVFRYDIENSKWMKLGNIPFRSNAYFGIFGFSINNIGYYLAGENFYSYNQPTDTWSKMQDIPSEYTYSAEVIGDKVYVFADNKEIWMYDQNTNQWQKETAYPGIWNGKIVGLNIHDNLYFGLSYNEHRQDGVAAQDFWRYSVSSKLWKQIEKFPFNHSQIEVFTFSLDNYGYIGFNTSPDIHNIWKFSEEKIIE